MKRILIVGVIISTLMLSACYYGPCQNGSGPIVTEVRDVTGFTGVSNTVDFDVYVSQSDSFSVEVVANESLLPVIETYVSGYTLIVKTMNNACYRSNTPVKVYVSLPELAVLSLSGSGRLIADIAENYAFECANNGSGYVGIDTVYADKLLITNSGSGTVEVKGAHADEITMVQSGSGILEAGVLFEPDEVSIRHSSSGLVRTAVVGGNMLDAIMSGSGGIELAGDITETEHTLSSSGRIDALDMEAFDAKVTSSGTGNVYVWATDFLEATITGSGDIIYRGDPAISFRITGSGSLRSY